MRNYLTLTNATHPIKQYERPKQLVQAPYAEKGMLIDPEVKYQLVNLIETINCSEKIIVTDAYRTNEKQQQIWHSTISERGEIFTKKYVARPGCSEHELGLAIDLGLANVVNDYIIPSFSSGPVVEKFLAKMADFGFILRYPKGKEQVTGISFEPWHFRYVGTPHSQIMTEQNLVLEEYLEVLKKGRELCHEG